MNKITIGLGVGTLTFALFDYISILRSEYCSVTCLHNFDGIGFYWFTVLGTSFVLSLLTFLISNVVHAAWWKFARITIPGVLLGSWLISLGLHHNPGGFFNMDNYYDLVGLAILYLIFVIGSIVQIYRGYKFKMELS
jgi:hypothetical protein